MSATDSPDDSGPLMVTIRSRQVPLVLSRHAVARMQLRRVALDDVIAALERPTVRNAMDTDAGQKHVGLDLAYRGRRLNVIYAEADDGTVTVITVMFSQ